MSGEKKQRYSKRLTMRPEVWDDNDKNVLSFGQAIARLNALTDQLEDTLAELRNAKSAREITRDHMQQKIDKLTEENDAYAGLGEIIRDEYADCLHTRADYQGYDAKPLDWIVCAMNTLQPLAALTRRVEALEAALRRCVERECYCADGQQLLDDFECASCEGKRALAQRSEPDPRRNRNRGERVCAECNYMARIGHVCTKCGAPDPAWNDQRSEDAHKRIGPPGHHEFPAQPAGGEKEGGEE